MRNIFIHLDKIVIISEYNKTDALLEHPKVIARYLPERVGCLMVSYVADVLAFEVFLDAAANADPITATCPFLWHDSNGKCWDSDRLSVIMSKASKDKLGYRLTLSRWRHHAIAIDQQLIHRPTGPSASIATNHAMQAGHTKDTEDQHYALHLDILRGTSHEMLLAFDEVSTAWHHFWGLDMVGEPVAEMSLSITVSDLACRMLQQFQNINTRLSVLLDGSSAEWSAVMTDSLTSLHPSAATPLQNDKVLVALRALYGNDAQFRTDEQ